ncbi:MAG: hypothetical protein E5V63_27320 [Mesorhizobium sp.]|nr:MAG: hypothetical protein E5W59_07725 [Mesorhizobium sp.]TIU01262.1 MAG: hypothetical protein E5W55_00860 [Mesorhizobium sp.]TIW22288.1 MAG: hypothetical protein E5V63_27320 [Mesorhizobium sp.]
MATIGVLCLSNGGNYTGEDPDFAPGLVDPSRYKLTPLYRQIPGAWASNVVAGDPSCEIEYVKAAQALVREGANAITCDCGFTVRYQQAIAEAVPVPVSTSSLLLLPTLLANLPETKKIAVITADSRCLDADILARIGIDSPSRLVIEGLEGTDTYNYMWDADGRIDPKRVLADIDNIITILSRHDDIGAILCECTILVRVSGRIRRATSLPVYDAFDNASLLMAGVG